MATPPRARPSWQDDPCPPWCAVEHAEDDPPAHRVHDTAGQYLPVTLGDPHRLEHGSSEVLLLMSRRCGDFRDWVFVGEPDRNGQHLALSRESASRMAHELLRLTTAIN